MNKTILLFLTIFSTSAFGMNPNIQLMEAARKGNIPEITAALNEGANINYQDDYCVTPLMKAVYSNSATVEFLIDKGANINARAIRGDALLSAIWIKKFKIVKILVSTPNIKIENYHLDAAIRSEEPKIVKAFLSFPSTILREDQLKLARELQLEYANNIEICNQELEKNPNKKKFILSKKIDQESFFRFTQIVKMLSDHFEKVQI